MDIISQFKGHGSLMASLYTHIVLICLIFQEWLKNETVCSPDWWCQWNSWYGPSERAFLKKRMTSENDGLHV